MASSRARMAKLVDRAIMYKLKHPSRDPELPPGSQQPRREKEQWLLDDQTNKYRALSDVPLRARCDPQTKAKDVHAKMKAKKEGKPVDDMYASLPACACLCLLKHAARSLAQSWGSGFSLSGWGSRLILIPSLVIPRWR